MKLLLTIAGLWLLIPLIGRLRKFFYTPTVDAHELTKEADRRGVSLEESRSFFTAKYKQAKK